jgi:hypothetical protein
MLTVASAPVATAHNAVGGGNVASVTTGTTNGSLFVAVNNSTSVSAALVSTAAGVWSATGTVSKGLLAKDSSSGTAQTATMLAGGTLALYAKVSTAVAWSSSGGSFSSVQPHFPAGASLYGTANATAIPATYTSADATMGTATDVATLWTAPTTPGTYTVSLLTGFVQKSDGTYVFPSYTVGLSPTLSGKITVSVVAASAGGSYSAVYSACNTNVGTQNRSVSATAPYPNGVDSGSSVADGGNWFIDFTLRDGYNQALDAGNIVATATNGALVNIGTDAGSTPVAGTATTDVQLGDGTDYTVIIGQPTAGAPVTTTVTISYNGTTVCTKTVTIRGKAAKLTVANVGTQKLSGTTTGSQHWMGAELGIFNDSLFTVVASDSAGNLVSTPATYGTYSADAATLTTTVQGIAVTTRSSSSSSTADERFNFGTWYCGATAGSASVKLKFTIAGTGDVITSDAFTARCADSPYTFTAALDRSSYIQGDIATVTLQFLDSKGNKANNVAAIGAGVFNLPMMTQIDGSASASAVTKADGTRVIRFSVAASGAAVTAGTYTGTISYGALAAAATATPTYKISTGSTDVAFSEILKSVVALIASINKQIQALQKLILSRKR